MRNALFFSLVLGACSGPRATPPAQVPVSPIAEAEPAPLQAFHSDAHVIFETEADLGGDALEPVRLHQDGILRVGTAGARVAEGLGSSFSESLFGVPVPGHVIIGIPQSDEEDPPRRWIVFKHENNQLTIVFDQVLPNQYVDSLELEINAGEFSVGETYNTTCDRYWAPRNYEGMGDDMEVAVPVESERIVFRDNEEVRREPTGQTVDCRGGIAACPFVYLVDGDDEELMGEVLRNVRGEDAYTTQGLALTGDAGEEITIVVREEKPEVTFLDHVALVVGGQAVAPEQCAAMPAPAFCEADHVPHRLAEGEELTLTFRAPAGSRELVATGYYIPVPPR